MCNFKTNIAMIMDTTQPLWNASQIAKAVENKATKESNITLGHFVGISLITHLRLNSPSDDVALCSCDILDRRCQISLHIKSGYKGKYKDTNN